MIDATGRPQSVLVLGGASEIAQAIVAGLVPGRCRTVVLAGRPSERLDAGGGRGTGRRGRRGGDRGLRHHRPRRHPAVVDAVFARFGDIDLVLAAAGALGDQSELETDPQAAADLITTNFTGLAAALLAAARDAGPGLRAHRRDLVGGRRAGPQGQLRLRIDQVRPRRLRPGPGRLAGRDRRGVTIVRPGFVVGRMTEGMDPAPFSTTPEAVAEAVVKGIESGADVVYAPPVLRWVFAVMRQLPRAVWRRMPG